jgi:hypothetical protein
VRYFNASIRHRFACSKILPASGPHATLAGFGPQEGGNEFAVNSAACRTRAPVPVPKNLAALRSQPALWTDFAEERHDASGKA